MQASRGTGWFYIEDGRLSLEFSSGANIYVDTPDHQPLSRSERHATLRIVSDVESDGVTRVELDADQLDELQSALSNVTEASDD